MSPESHAADEPRTQGSLQWLLFDMITAYRISQMVCVAAKLGIADLLKDGPLGAEGLARATGTHAPSLYRLLRALASRGVFAEDEQGRFALTPLAELLRSDVPGSLRPAAIFFGDESEWRPWGELLYSITTGEPAFRHLYDMDAWEYRARRPELNAAFDGFMTSRTNSQAGHVVSAYDFSWAAMVVDVGGGHGTLISAVLRANPHLRGILCDAPQVVAGAPPVLEAAGVLDRCEIEACNFFESVPADGDLYILKKIIHDWDDERSVEILRTCRQAMTPNGRLLLVENIIPPGNDPHFAKLLDLQMLVELGGRERTEDEYRALLVGAGFRLTRVQSGEPLLSIIEAVPE